MSRALAQVGCAMSLLAILLPRTAAADPVEVDMTIRTGEIVIEFAGQLSGRIDIGGEGGFRFDAIASSGNSPSFCQPCVPGERISLGTYIITPFSGTLHYEGTGHDFNFDLGAGEIVLTAPSFVLPVSAGDTATFTSLFTLGGFLSTANPANNIRFNLSGTGQVTGTFRVLPLMLEPQVPGAQQYLLDSLVYDFDAESAPVPEPGTLGMLAAGLSAWIARSRHRRARGG